MRYKANGSAEMTDTSLVRARGVVGRRVDKPRANTATAHKLARMVYFMLSRGEHNQAPRCCTGLPAQPDDGGRMTSVSSFVS